MGVGDITNLGWGGGLTGGWPPPIVENPVHDAVAYLFLVQGQVYKIPMVHPILI